MASTPASDSGGNMDIRTFFKRRKLFEPSDEPVAVSSDGHHIEDMRGFNASDSESGADVDDTLSDGTKALAAAAEVPATAQAPARGSTASDQVAARKDPRSCHCALCGRPRGLLATTARTPASDSGW